MNIGLGDREMLLKEHERLMVQQNEYFQSIVTTERFALAGSAAVVAFLYTDLPTFAAGQARVLALLPGAIIVLAALRCLSIYMVMRASAMYLRLIEDTVFEDRKLGFHHAFFRDHPMPFRVIEVTTTGFWLLAIAAAALFWLAYRPAVSG